jgi:hypothetical protein
VRRLTYADTARLRAVPGRSVLLYLTDRCPVECRHCSVGSVADGPRITDWPLFDATVAGIAALPGVEVVAISGGEPFVERRGLPRAVSAFRAAGHDVVIFTSGYWAPEHREPAAWITDVLAQTATVFLSTDAFHDERIPISRFTAALRIIAAAGPHIVVQLLDEPATVDAATGALRAAFGDRWSEHAEINRITPLRRGRGRDLFRVTRLHEAREIGPCTLLGSPTIRYDGVVTPCCNESLITGAGPRALRQRVGSAPDVGAALTTLREDDVLRLIGSIGPAGLATLPGFESLAEGRYEDVCGACWAAFRLRDDRPAARHVAALAGAIVSGASNLTPEEGRDG